MDNKVSVGTAIGKVILIGEHSVVYGEPAIAIPFDATNVKATIFRSKGPVNIHCFYYKGLISHAPKVIDGLIQVVKSIVKSFNEELKDFSLCIESTIPPERGMGSSAAVAIATIRGLYDFFGRALTHEELLNWAHISEKIVHGNPSGIDAAIVGGERTLYYIKGEPFTPFEFNLDAYLVVGDTGRKGQTKDAIEDVRKYIETNPKEGKAYIEELGKLTRAAKDSIESNDPIELGKLMTKAHIILDKLGVSDDGLNVLVSRALNSGALGAKLTGGGRGGCMIALATNKEEASDISKALLNSGAKNTWISRLGDGLIDK
jgi:mevalonate kinase